MAAAGEKGRLDYSRFDKLEDSDDEKEQEEWKLTDAERKARKDKKRDEMIQKELDGYKEIDEKMKRAEKLPVRLEEARLKREQALKAPEGEYSASTEPTSWSSGRTKQEKAEKEVALAKERLAAVEAILGQLADDPEMQSDLKRPVVLKALRHWTNEARLPQEEAQALFDENSYEFNQYLKPVLSKLSRLQAACKHAVMGVPIDALLNGRRTILQEQPPPQVEPTEKELRAKARKDFEDAVFKDMPPPVPFTWKKLGRQIALQTVVMAAVMLYFRFFIRPGILEEHAKQAAEQSSTAPDGVYTGPEDDF